MFLPDQTLVMGLQPKQDTVQFSRSVMSDSLKPHGLQHARLPCPSPTPGAYSNSCPPSQWCHPTITSSVIPFSVSLQSFPASGSHRPQPCPTQWIYEPCCVGPPKTDRSWWRVLTKHGGNGKPLQYSCLENPMNPMKKKLLYYLAISFMAIYSKQLKAGPQWDSFAMLIVALLTTVKKCKQFKYLSTDKCVNKILCIQKMEYYSTLKRKEVL